MTRLGVQTLNLPRLVLGAACSEVFTGPRLAKVLRPALDHQKTAIENMEMDKPWEPLAIHTSAGVLAAEKGQGEPPYVQERNSLECCRLRRSTRARGLRGEPLASLALASR